MDDVWRAALDNISPSPARRTLQGDIKKASAKAGCPLSVHLAASQGLHTGSLSGLCPMS